MTDREKIIGKITEMLCRIADENLLNRIYKFVKYVYLYRDGRGAV